MRRFGPVLSSGGVDFRLWAPDAKHVDVVLTEKRAMTRGPSGWHTLHETAARPGMRYAFLIDGEIEVPDPASHFQPDDIRGRSEIVDHSAYRWRTAHWKGRPWHETVILECHVGTFTAEGTYRGVTQHLDDLVDTGITALELMPLNDFPGNRNWGYDGALWYAPDHSYGTPDDLKSLVDAAHARGMMIFLDVVYNHFGPEGNYLGRYASEFFRDVQTPWGAAINYGHETVRAFAIENALHWLETYRFDGLRLDAVHAFTEPGGLELLAGLSKAVGDLTTATGRHIHLMLENDDNRSQLLDPAAIIPDGKYRAQWNDDYHHAWHVLLTGETQGYYRDYTSPRRQIARMLQQGFAYQGEFSQHRNRPRGEPSRSLSPLSFINFLQNHDQIGNRALGDRLEWSAEPAQIEAALQILLLAPMIPMLFMGEEWGSRASFPFFCDFKGELADAVRKGRRREFAEAYETYGDNVPDPLSEDTRRSATLDWSERELSRRLSLVTSLLKVRSREVIPRLPGCGFADAAFDTTEAILRAAWTLGKHGRLAVAANLTDRARDRSPAPHSRPIWGEAEGHRLAPWSVIWWIEE